MSRVGTSRRRHLSHSKRFKRQETHPEWAAGRADDAANGGIGDTAAGTTFTAANATNIFTAVAHGFTNTEGPMFVSNAGGALPAGLDAAQLYWVILLTDDTFQLAAGKQAAFGISVTPITDDGTGTQTIQRAASTGDSITEWNRQKNRPRTIQNLTDIDDL